MNLREQVISVAVKNNAGHIAPSLSCLEILQAIYDVIGEHDRFILSKSHGGYGLYAILAERGIIPKDKWESFSLPGCVERMDGIEAGCGALGHGLPIAVGLAWGLKLQNKPGRVFCLMGDGETQEGTTWEALQFASHHKLDNLTVIVDCNGLQAMDFIGNVMGGDIAERFTAFGVRVVHRDGHDIQGMRLALKWGSWRPYAIMAKTVKGKGLKCMENVPKFHYRIPTGEELAETNY
uniref:Putative transketolase domain containing protein n=1 Tax=viral metagenome TaxID=1070528 RepID=A0A6M3KES2_9ZZZZ